LASSLATRAIFPAPRAIPGRLFDIQLITKLRDNMKNRLMVMADRILLRHRAIIESVIDQLKNISQIEHSRHHSVVSFFVNVLAA